MVALPQYSVFAVVSLWAAAALPMAALGWVVNPWLVPAVDGFTGIVGTARLLLLTVGLIWQSVLVMVLVRREDANASWRVMRERLWLGPPRNPRTGLPNPKLWLWLLLLVPAFGASVFLVSPVLNRAWVAALPFLAEPPEFSFSRLMAQSGQSLTGAWWFYGLFVVMATFNTVLGEELLFRGLLLPRMFGAFGRWAWLANGVLFGLYHLHQPWGIPGSIATGTLLFALPATLLRTAWMGIAVHSVQSVYLALALLPAFLGRT